MQLISVIAALLAVTAQAMAHTSLLECKGYSVQLNRQINHEIAIHDTMAEFDGQQYQLSEAPLQFRLIGPIPANDTIVYIYRLIGTYAITSVSANGDVKRIEWSREDEGCHEILNEK
jgi:hypothetical protein